MEKPNFRDNLQRISEVFDKELIPFLDVCNFLGTTRKALDNDKKFPKMKVGGRYYVSQVALAKWLS